MLALLKQSELLLKAIFFWGGRGVCYDFTKHEIQLAGNKHAAVVVHVLVFMWQISSKKNKRPIKFAPEA